jgi:NAD(P)-dependent dehydrogenase (short-subunit alcohol dehydrogenase family)
MSVFRDRVVLITGAASGIGRQLALLLAAEGAKIAALDLQAQGLESLQTELVGRTFVRRTVDVTDLSALRQVVRDIEGQIGGDGYSHRVGRTGTRHSGGRVASRGR